MYLGCRIGIHNWGKWSEPYSIPDGHVTQQLRCLDCNRARVSWRFRYFNPPKAVNP